MSETEADSEANEDVKRLWTAVVGEPPSVNAPTQLLLDILVSTLPPAPPYKP